MQRGLLTVFLLMVSATACSKPAPKSIEELRSAAREVSLTLVDEIEGGPGYSAFVYSYQSAGLKVHALVAMPSELAPEDGYPVVIANHGHHPDPPKYGITSDGKDWRPGDYYRQIPELFVASGFVVVMPDYRGHNNSEGFEFTEGMLESSYYTEDVLNLLAGLDSLDRIDQDNAFMWGHSMGGEVTLRTLVASDRIKGASMWSSVGGDIWDQSYYYSRYSDPAAFDSSETPKSVIDRLRGRIAALNDDFDYRGVEPLLHLDRLNTPIIIQHAVGDRGAAYKWSERLAKELYLRGNKYEFYSYAGDDHLFTGATLELAVERDAAFFRSLMLTH
ncbi:MAG: alpha/beta hydrolase family protein [Woeseiaceae bacterium]